MEIYVDLATQDAIKRVNQAALDRAGDMERRLNDYDPEVRSFISAGIEAIKRDVLLVEAFDKNLNLKREHGGR
jgi:hypothetical protein